MLYDKDIREPLFEYFEEHLGKVRVIEEKQIGKARADVMLVMDATLIGVEIKSDADTYARLEKQVMEYNRCFDKNYVVVGTKHASHIEEHVPDWWGIITVEEADGKVDFYVLREPLINPRNHQMFFRKRQLDFLWRMELTEIQLKHGLYKYPGKSKLFVRDYIYDSIDEDTLKLEITDALFERDYQKMVEQITEYRDAHRSVRKKKRRTSKK
ncbi:MAG: sce7726 family protein [Lachnospiraceae bacterium]|nr:sce7726 family protein [Lachnospiraceae bacterium]